MKRTWMTVLPAVFAIASMVGFARDAAAQLGVQQKKWGGRDEEEADQQLIEHGHGQRRRVGLMRRWPTAGVP